MKKLFLIPVFILSSAIITYGQSPNYGSGFSSGALTLNGGAVISGTRLRLTDGGAGEDRSAFFNPLVNVQSFTNDFSFQLTNADADGFTFTIQGNSPNALGIGGGSLGYGPNGSGALGIGNSVAVKFDLYSNAGEGTDSTGWYTNGASPTVPSTDMSASGVDLHSGDVMNVHMTYDGTTLVWTITDSSTGANFSTSATVNIPTVVGGNTAYVGFTGGTGGLAATQDVVTWSYTPSGTPPPPQVATPTFNPLAGTYNTIQSVAISDTTSGAAIYYTTDGTTPTASSTPYSGPITVSSTTTIEALAAANGMTNSAVATATYTIQTGGGGGTPNYGGGFSSGGLTLNGGAILSGTRLRLTDGGTGEGRSAFFNSLVNVQGFTNDFSFQLTNADADGFTFTVQGNSPNALGIGGGSLGYGPNNSGALGIGNSVAVKFDLYSNAGEGTDSTGWYTNGASPTVPSTDMSASGVDLHSGDVMNVHMTYDGTTLVWTITDSSTGANFSTSATVNIPTVVGGNTAYVGFTGGTGGLAATQDVVTWSYTPSGTPPPPQVATPTFNPLAGTYNTIQSVAISDTTSGAAIYYTTDGTTPTASSTPYSGPITVSSTTTIEALAAANGMTNSAVATATYTIQTGGGGGTPNYGGGFSSGGLTLNGGAILSGTRLRLTDGGTGEGRSAFFNSLVNVQGFTNDFSFQLTNADADGFTFTVQGNSPNALGIGGGSLGYGPNNSGALGIGNSVAVKFDLYSNAGEGTDSTGWYTNGASPTVPSTDMSASGVDLHSGDVMNVHMTYDGTTLVWTITDSSTGANFSTSATVNIPTVVGGNTAYVGFTGGTGGLAATQDVVTWSYTPSGTPPPPQVATPTFNPVAGTYSVTQSVAISDTTSGAVIYYTTNGTTPTTSSTPYGGPITVSSTTTIEALAAANGMTNSAVATATYTIQTGGGGGTPNYGGGFSSGGLTLNGGAILSGTRLRLTDGGTGEGRSAFFNTLVNVQSFTNDFSFQLTNADADGFTFTIQGNSPNALGIGGGSLGYGPNNSGALGIGNSVAVKFDLYSNAGEGTDSTAWYTNGASPTVPSTDMSASGVDLHSGDVMNVHMTYDGTTLVWTITDSSTGANFSTSATVNIPTVVGGNTAYVGFTGGTGGLAATQDVLTWTYTVGFTPPPPETFAWPVATPASIAYEGGNLNNDYSTNNQSTLNNWQYHTGMDLCPPVGCTRGEPVYATSDGFIQSVFVTSDASQTLCDGTTTGSLPTDDNYNLGNAVIIAHANGKFSLYGHMDCVWPGIAPGVQVSQGQRLGNIGNSAFGDRQFTFIPHLHFEMKDSGVLGDPANQGLSGYTPDLPDGYGYHDPRIYLFPFTTTNITPVAVRIVASSLNVVTGPASTYALLTTVSAGQEFVAFATSGSWYQIYLPNSQASISGWIQGGQNSATPDTAATQIQVLNTNGTGLLIRPGPSGTTNLVTWNAAGGVLPTFSNCSPSAKIWDGQRFVSPTNQGGWYEFYLPNNFYLNSSGSCGAPAGDGPSVGWSSGSFLNHIP